MCKYMRICRPVRFSLLWKEKHPSSLSIFSYNIVLILCFPEPCELFLEDVLLPVPSYVSTPVNSSPIEHLTVNHGKDFHHHLTHWTKLPSVSSRIRMLQKMQMWPMVIRVPRTPTGRKLVMAGSSWSLNGVACLRPFPDSWDGRSSPLTPAFSTRLQRLSCRHSSSLRLRHYKCPLSWSLAIPSSGKSLLSIVPYATAPKHWRWAILTLNFFFI